MKRMETSRIAVENQWFSKQEKKLLEKKRAERAAEQKLREDAEATEKRAALKDKHWMCCPKCGHQMEEQDMHHIKVDICTFCSGIYFDRGELEDLLVFHQENNRGFFRALLGLK
jgi:uncharacterized protein